MLLDNPSKNVFGIVALDNWYEVKNLHNRRAPKYKFLKFLFVVENEKSLSDCNRSWNERLFFFEVQIFIVEQISCLSKIFPKRRRKSRERSFETNLLLLNRLNLWLIFLKNCSNLFLVIQLNVGFEELPFRNKKKRFLCENVLKHEKLTSS